MDWSEVLFLFYWNNERRLLDSSSPVELSCFRELVLIFAETMAFCLRIRIFTAFVSFIKVNLRKAHHDENV